MCTRGLRKPCHIVLCAYMGAVSQITNDARSGGRQWCAQAVHGNAWYVSAKHGVDPHVWGVVCVVQGGSPLLTLSRGRRAQTAPIVCCGLGWRCVLLGQRHARTILRRPDGGNAPGCAVHCSGPSCGFSRPRALLDWGGIGLPSHAKEDAQAPTGRLALRNRCTGPMGWRRRPLLIATAASCSLRSACVPGM